MTRDEFERRYAEKSGFPVERLHAMGLRGYPCHCGESCCKGWAMVCDELVEDEIELGHLTREEVEALTGEAPQ